MAKLPLKENSVLAKAVIRALKHRSRPAQVASGLLSPGITRLVRGPMPGYPLPMLKVYAYSACSTCRNASKWLKGNEIPFQELAIRETPPSKTELKAMLDAKKGNLRAIFNTSGMDYRALGLKDKLPSMPPDEALELLSTNGMLVKRPFVLNRAAGVFLTGFKEAEWQKALK